MNEMLILTRQILARVGYDADVVSEPLAEQGRRLSPTVGGGTRELTPGTVSAFALLNSRRYLLLPLESDTNNLPTAMLFWDAISEQEDLDRALPPEAPVDRGWPLRPLGIVLKRRAQAFDGKPQVADHAVACLAQYRLLSTPPATGMILDLLGDNVHITRRDYRAVAAWPHVILNANRDANVGHRRRLLGLLDELADVGDADAVELQRELELQ